MSSSKADDMMKGEAQDQTQSTHVEGASVPKIANVFNQNTKHINHADNTVVEKLPPVEYEIEPMQFGFQNYEPKVDPSQDQLMLGAHGELYNSETRPLETLDTGFEKLIQRRLARFHGSLIERTQFDQETLEKQLDLEIITITLKDEGDETRKEFTEHG